MSIIEPQSWERAILQQRELYPNLTDLEFAAYFANKFPAVTEKQVLLVIKVRGGEQACIK